VNLCSTCGKENREQAHFCGYCGQALPATSPVLVGEARTPEIQAGSSPQRENEEEQIHRLSFHGTAGSLFGIHLVNIFLTLITLGVYYFWGKVRVRNYLLSQSEFEGDRFAYHGTGKELLIGFLKAVVAFGVPLWLLDSVQSLLNVGAAIQVVIAVLTSALFLMFTAVATVGARRYRLSRTSWRGVRFSFRGQVKEFFKLLVKGSLLSIVTLGLYYPIFAIQRHGFLVSHSYFGNRRFHFDGRGQDLLGLYFAAFFGLLILLVLFFLPLTFFLLGISWWGAAVVILLGFVLLSFIWCWFSAWKQRYLWDHTSFGPAHFRSTVTGGRLFALKLGNLLLLVATLGLGWPWAVVRNVRFTFSYLTVEGRPDLASIQQEAQTAPATGEGLADFLGLDADLG
jgi:uncharacterized membrane protein YjgN (DUF898 family)